MFVSMSHAQAKKVSLMELALTISLCTQAQLCHQAYALPFIAAKNLQTPMDAKLESNSLDENTKDSNTKDSNNKDANLPLKPVKLEIENSKGRPIDHARHVNVMPMLLMDTDAEAEGKALSDRECEKTQLSELWGATLSRSPDIQFVVQKLMPSSDRNHATNALLRMISSMLASTANAGGVILGPNPATFLGTQMTSSLLYQINGWQDSKANKNAQIDQSQAIMLYQMVRNTAEKVTETYRDYKFHARRIDTAQVRALKLQNLIQDARAGQDALKQIEMEYWVDKATADIEEAVYLARRYRNSLLDLAGVEAVCKLDQSIQDQFIAEKDIENKRKNNVADDGNSNVPDRTREVLTKLLNAGGRP